MEKIKGIVFAYQVRDDNSVPEQLEFLKDLGFRWMRMHIPFPWEDKMFGTLSAQYLRSKEELRKAHAAGFELMVTTPGLGGYRFDEALQKTRWMETLPAFLGEKGSEAYYKNLADACEFIARDLSGIAGEYWQCMNEIDNPIFASHYSDEIVAGTARAQAEGIVRGDPKAKCGINLSKYDEQALRIADLVYAPGHSFGYLGDDQYFGSWQPGTVESWTAVIDALWERYHLPVLANEWGYSSGGEYSTEHVDPKIVPFGLPEECLVQKWFYEVPGGHTEEVQAEYLYKGLQIFAEHPHCIGSFLFCFRDAYKCYHCGGESCPSEDFWGIVRKDLTKKPACEAVKKAFREFYQE